MSCSHCQRNWPRWLSKINARLYDLLFRATADTLQSIAADPQHLGAQIGFFCILHSWGQALNFHPHLHCVVPGGGISLDGSRWVACRPGFFLPVKVLSLPVPEALPPVSCSKPTRQETAVSTANCGIIRSQSFARYLAPLHDSEWVVYAKKPFGGPGSRARLSGPLYPSCRHLQ